MKKRYLSFVLMSVLVSLLASTLAYPNVSSAEIQGLGFIDLDKYIHNYGEELVPSLVKVPFVTDCLDGPDHDDSAFSVSISDVWLVPSVKKSESGTDEPVIPLGPDIPEASMPPVALATVGEQTTVIMGASVIQPILAVIKKDMHGYWDIVLDHCQDGKFHYKQDYILRNQIYVNQDSKPDNPELKWQLLKGKYERRSRACAGNYNTWSFIGSVAEQFASTVKKDDPMPGTTMVKLLASKGYSAFLKGFAFCRLAYNLLHDDPPDPDYTKLASLILVDRRPYDVDNELGLAATMTADVVGNEAALAEMLLHSMERYQGAEADGRPDWQLIHARAIRSEIELLVPQIARADSSIQTLSEALSNDSSPIDDTVAVFESTRTRIVGEGFSAEERRVLLNLGFTDEGLEDVRNQL